PAQNIGLPRFSDSCLFTILLKEGISRKTAIKEKRNAIKARIRDSKKNCSINCFLRDPNVFRTPTSFALFSERAVERFMKLIQAMRSMIKAMMLKSLTYSIIPPAFFPSLKSLYNRHLLMGKVK